MRTLYAIIMLGFMVATASCQNNTNNNAASGKPQSVNLELRIDEYEQKLKTLKEVQLIDVRTPEEYSEGHLSNAKNIDIGSSDFEAQLGKLDKEQPVLVYCLSGGRSLSAANTLETMGFSEIYNLKGGLMKWRNAGKPLEEGLVTNAKLGMSIDDLNKKVAENEYVLVDYNAKWCQPCKKMLPILEALAERKKETLTLLKIDADDNKQLLALKNISSIPYLELYHNGKLIWKNEGYIDEANLLAETKL